MDEDELADVKKSVNAEIAIFKKINSELQDNEFLIQIHGIYQTANTIYIVMEYCPDGNL